MRRRRHPKRRSSLRVLNPRRRRHHSRRARRNPYSLQAPARRHHRRRRHRGNPLVPTGLLQKGLAVAAGFLAAPRLTKLIPFDFPGGKVGEYVKEFLVIMLGSQLAKKALGAKYGNALFAGGVIHIGVDMLQTYVPAFGGGGVGYYFPPDDQLALTYGTSPGTGAAGMLPPETFSSGDVARLSSRFG